MPLRVNNARVTDAKEVGVGNPAEETFYHPDTQNIAQGHGTVNTSAILSDRATPHPHRRELNGPEREQRGESEGEREKPARSKV